LIEQGLDPDEIDYEGTELERTVSNRDTLRKQWEEIMEVCHKDESGQYPGKMIVFAVIEDHALRWASLFEKTSTKIRLLKSFLLVLLKAYACLRKRFSKKINVASCVYCFIALQ
jgi:type I site-specific restriction endonuclease